jgi:hypothetical protein
METEMGFQGTISKLSERKVAAAASIDANADILVLTGAVGVATIVPKASGIAGQRVTLVAFDSTIALANSGNIATAATLTVGRTTTLVYTRATGKWHAELAAV